MIARFGIFIFFLFSAFTASARDMAATDRVVYGDDDRKDVYQVTDPQWVQRAGSTVAMIPSNRLKPTPTGYEIMADVYGDTYKLCKNEPFYDQTYASFCSGSLIAPDIVMTAGHCVGSLNGCQKIRFVFNYAYRTEHGSSTDVVMDDVYSCKELIHTQKTAADFALIRLDRPVVGRQHLEINRTGKIRQGDSLVLIGNPAGIPTKVAAGAKVLNDSTKGYFVADTDSYGGNSGSAVFNSSTGLIEGVLVRGEDDFIYKNGCYISNKCKGLEDCRGEDVTRIEEVLKYLPKR